jgi:hypothetical protein
MESQEGKALKESPIREREVLLRWQFISPAMLRTARDNGQIAWIRGKWNSRLYRTEAVEAFIASLECPVREQGHSLKSQGNGSPKTHPAPTSTDSGLSPELVERAAQASAQRILKPPISKPKK